MQQTFIGVSSIQGMCSFERESHVFPSEMVSIIILFVIICYSYCENCVIISSVNWCNITCATKRYGKKLTAQCANIFFYFRFLRIDKFPQARLIAFGNYETSRIETELNWIHRRRTFLMITSNVDKQTPPGWEKKINRTLILCSAASRLLLIVNAWTNTL